MLILKPTTLKAANTFVDQYHRHHKATIGHKFSISIIDDEGKTRGVVIAGRPVSRNSDDGWTCEVTRLCTDGVKNGCSILYSAAARAAKAMGYRRIQTYILETESGGSLIASGWTYQATTQGGAWKYTNQTRNNNHPTVPKHRYGKVLLPH